MEVHSCQDEYKNVEIHQILDLSDNVGLALPRSFRIVVFSLISCQYWASNEVIQSTKLFFGAFFLCSASPSVCVCVCVINSSPTGFIYLVSPLLRRLIIMSHMVTTPYTDTLQCVLFCFLLTMLAPLNPALLAYLPNQVFSSTLLSRDHCWYNKSFAHHFLSLFSAFWS